MPIPDRPERGLVEAPDWGEGIDSRIGCSECDNTEIYR